MRRPPVTSLFSVPAILLLATVTVGAEAVKLKQIRSIYADEKEIGLRSPEGVGCDDKGRLVVADSGNGRLVRFTFVDGNLTPGKEIKVPELSVPIRVRINSKGEVFALDGRQKRVVRLSPEGEFRGHVDAAGSPPPATIVPRSLDIGMDDAIYLLDAFAGRVLVLTPEGKFARQLDFPGDYEFISDLAVDGRGNIFLIDSINAAVYRAPKESGKFSPLTESMKETMSFPSSIVTDGRGNIYVADKNAGVMFVLGQDGSFKGEQLKMGWKEGLLRYPSQLCINDSGEIFVADRENNRIQVFSTVR